MTTRIRDIIILINLLVVVALLGTTFLNEPAPKTAYIQLNKTYEGFYLKKELEQKYDKIENARQSILDSMSIDLQTMASQLSAQPKPNQEQVYRFQAKQEVFLKKQQQFQEDNERLSQQYNDQIMKQLNQYVKDFGSDNAYSYIYGADGSGTLMYADDVADVTDEVVDFINQKYQGS